MLNHLLIQEGAAPVSYTTHPYTSYLSYPPSPCCWSLIAERFSSVLSIASRETPNSPHSTARLNFSDLSSSPHISPNPSFEGGAPASIVSSFSMTQETERRLKAAPTEPYSNRHTNLYTHPYQHPYIWMLSSRPRLGLYPSRYTPVSDSSSKLSRRLQASLLDLCFQGGTLTLKVQNSLRIREEHQDFLLLVPVQGILRPGMGKSAFEP